MSVLLLRLTGPMQSWGVQSRFAVRDTGLEPSKSGVIGLLCAALGRPRSVPVADLASLRMAVRVDREGRLMRDYHTALDVLKAGGGLKVCEPSARYYLADACFVAALEGDAVLLTELHAALHAPVWPLFLGRKAFVPSEQVWLPDGLWLDETLESACTRYPWLGRAWEKRPALLRLVIDDVAGSEQRLDVPLSFAERRFAPRRVSTRFIAPSFTEEAPCISPD
ncbi:MAG: type I-E CRISPR-associated protein Cas5/CasD [Ardenticatenaceae bacterium]|nr:type I-E CRISPR-associated protein Cas5/CasD [Ardenticatenaceae bacterium]